MRKKGFTLIELLIVLFIISILAAMLFPVFSQARQKAHQITCLSYVQQLGTALQIYAQDWQGNLPRQDNDWRPLHHYAQAPEILHCPSDDRQVKLPDRAHFGSDYSQTLWPETFNVYASYIYRGGLHNDDYSQEILGFDKMTWHNGGRNIVMLDAHAKWMKDEKFWQIASPRVLALDPVFQALSQQDKASFERARLPVETPGRMEGRRGGPGGRMGGPGRMRERSGRAR